MLPQGIQELEEYRTYDKQQLSAKLKSVTMVSIKKMKTRKPIFGCIYIFIYLCTYFCIYFISFSIGIEKIL